MISAYLPKARTVLRACFISVIALTTIVGGQAGVHAMAPDNPFTRPQKQLHISAEMLPPEMGQTESVVFVSETKHSIGGTMLDYWRANGAASVYGNPISEPYAASNGYYSQAFERGIFQFLPEVIWTDDPTIRLEPIGYRQFDVDRDVFLADGRRVAGRRLVERTIPGSWDTTRQQDVWAEGGRFSNETGFSISGSFGEWYDNHEGWFYLGSPISEPYRDRGVTVQLFEGGMLMDRSGTVALASLPREQPELYGIDTAPMPQAGMNVYSESELVLVDNPYGIDTVDLPGRRSIVVDVSDQSLTAYQGDRIILQTPVSTGLAPNTTEIGAFHVRMKFSSQDMSGFTGSTGEVLSVGDSDGSQVGEQYLVEDVPNVMYINFDAEALHGAYWHDNFGQPMSHGCINLPLDVAEFLYDWAPLGTAVTVQE